MKGKTYVLSDIHGNFEIFKRMLEKIQFNNICLDQENNIRTIMMIKIQ